ncbi:MAG: thioesterase family protein [Bacillota bacterium]|uniref:thioesterase family protein n=1 Tax=Desulforudis sp. DRI-14 TaxID=3459793 RepID=UPI00348473EB
MLEPGKEGRVEITVTPNDTALAYGSGEVDVLSTPRMVALMEQAAVNCVRDALPEGMTSVGISLDIKHLAATPPGMRAEATARLVEVNDRRLVFEVEARDERDLIGRGRHERFIVDARRFLEKARAKRGTPGSI